MIKGKCLASLFYAFIYIVLFFIYPSEFHWEFISERLFCPFIEFAWNVILSFLYIGDFMQIEHNDIIIVCEVHIQLY